MKSWGERWLERAQHVASFSKDPSTQVGCVLVRDRRQIVEGYNGFPRGMKDDERYAIREVKYRLTCHAEANAIAFAARNGTSVAGCVAFITYPCCAECAKLLVQGGIVAVQVPDGIIVPERFREDAKWACEIFREVAMPYNFKIE